ncbi:hypothetical protein BU17DRAFT_45012 [Hysterangium stoloniferum]|nr:hypothetical protein BU17DRAFT_45012 [Hysterangium stoloniferum]
MNIFRKLSRVQPRVLVGPPHPVSNIRPVVFENRTTTTYGQAHPYSLTEFGGNSGGQTHDDLQLRMEQERLSSFNHAFWFESNSRFMRGKNRVLEQWEASGDKSVQTKEIALSQYYSQWVAQESHQQARYTTEWNRRNRLVMKLALRRQLNAWKTLITNMLVGQLP